jgi:hypothetical protein
VEEAQQQLGAQQNENRAAEAERDNLQRELSKAQDELVAATNSNNEFKDQLDALHGEMVRHPKMMLAFVIQFQHSLDPLPVNFSSFINRLQCQNTSLDTRRKMMR